MSEKTLELYRNQKAWANSEIIRIEKDIFSIENNKNFQVRDNPVLVSLRNSLIALREIIVGADEILNHKE